MNFFGLSFEIPFGNGLLPRLMIGFVSLKDKGDGDALQTQSDYLALVLICPLTYRLSGPLKICKKADHARKEAATWK